MNSRERVLKMFAGEEVDRPPCFSGMGNVTTEGLKSLGPELRGHASGREDDGRGRGVDLQALRLRMRRGALRPLHRGRGNGMRDQRVCPFRGPAVPHDQEETDPQRGRAGHRAPVRPHRARQGAAHGRRHQAAQKGHRRRSGRRLLRARAVHAGRPDHGAERPAEAVLQEAGQDRQAPGPDGGRDHPGGAGVREGRRGLHHGARDGGDVGRALARGCSRA